MSIKTALILSLASLILLTAVTLLVIGFSTDFWLKYDVHYNQIFQDLGRQPPTIGGVESTNRTKLLVDRTRGIFHWCYPDHRPSDVSLARRYVDTLCEKISFRLFSSMSENQKRRIHLMRTQIGFFVVSFIFFLLAFIVGITGCWKRNTLQILATALLIFLAAILATVGVGIFHAVHYIESKLLRDVPESITTFTVPAVVRRNTRIRFWWSYMISWIGVGLAFLSGLLFLISSCCVHRENRRSNRRYVQNYNANKVIVAGAPGPGMTSVVGKDRYMVPVYYDNTGANVTPSGGGGGRVLYDRGTGAPQPTGGGGGGGNTVYYDNGYYRSPQPPPPGSMYYTSDGRRDSTNTAGYGYGYYK